MGFKPHLPDYAGSTARLDRGEIAKLIVALRDSKSDVPDCSGFTATLQAVGNDYLEFLCNRLARLPELPAHQFEMLQAAAKRHAMAQIYEAPMASVEELTASVTDSLAYVAQSPYQSILEDKRIILVGGMIVGEEGIHAPERVFDGAAYLVQKEAIDAAYRSNPILYPNREQDILQFERVCCLDEVADTAQDAREVFNQYMKQRDMNRGITMN